MWASTHQALPGGWVLLHADRGVGYQGLLLLLHFAENVGILSPGRARWVLMHAEAWDRDVGYQGLLVIVICCMPLKMWASTH
eukprot:scaffold294418_cov17-Tisochrysis_lutea.AAC.1